ncbi:hypothetical protein K458DRAFT_394354 [Lentithecium fluviatile CBS 122367]|uniref:Uncharacterized protein n=1 Tax=Lentithecium fluviatile CBS 122367 TaxID=1168545 RepID=A0A6G1ILS3_9PLEO|nr:hypothetical protein K458DRAFT_394354 [Lentithecium fluviatile CBS 122367]
MEFYFLSNGVPDQMKTREALALYGFREQYKLRARAERILGLVTRSGSSDGDRTICIGRDRHAVSSLSVKLSAQASEKKANQLKAKKVQAMATHQAFARTVKEGSPNMTKSQKLSKCMGSCIIICDDIPEGWNGCDSLSFDIGPGPTLPFCKLHENLAWYFSGETAKIWINEAGCTFPSLACLREAKKAALAAHALRLEQQQRERDNRLAKAERERLRLAEEEHRQQEILRKASAYDRLVDADLTFHINYNVMYNDHCATKIFVKN